jgi:hypothetical protein
MGETLLEGRTGCTHMKSKRARGVSGITAASLSRISFEGGGPTCRGRKE